LLTHRARIRPEIRQPAKEKEVIEYLNDGNEEKGVKKNFPPGDLHVHGKTPVEAGNYNNRSVISRNCNLL
jgi:hypothetical protein